MSIYKVSETGNGLIDVNVEVPAGRHYRLKSITLKMSAAPTTSENFTINLDAKAGEVYDVEIYSLDLSAGSTTDLVFADGLSGWRDLILSGGDILSVDYLNTDVGQWGLQVTMERVG